MARSPCSHLISERKLKADVRGLRRLAWDDDVSVIVCRRLRPSSHVTRNSSSSRGSSPPPRLENEFFGRFRFRFLLRAPPARFPHPHRPTNSASSLPFDTPPVSISARLSTPHPLPPPPAPALSPPASLVSLKAWELIRWKTTPGSTRSPESRTGSSSGPSTASPICSPLQGTRTPASPCPRFNAVGSHRQPRIRLDHSSLSFDLSENSACINPLGFCVSRS